MPSSSDDASRTDPDRAVALSEAELYRLVHDATRDAVLDAVGTILLVGVGTVLFVAGVSAALGSLDPLGAGVGVALAVFGAYVAASALELIPSVRDLI